jgi:endonuclease YncB( thermonuclease family)
VNNLKKKCCLCGQKIFMRLCRYVILFFVAFIYSSYSPAQSLKDSVLHGKVTAIMDGDTFDMLVAGNLTMRMRLYGIDCPEKSQPYSQKAKNKLSGLVFGKNVRAVKKDVDRYGRTVAIVFVDSVNVNEAMLRAGLAWHFMRYDRNPRWAEIERRAREARKGLWADPGAIAPWAFRKR